MMPTKSLYSFTTRAYHSNESSHHVRGIRDEIKTSHVQHPKANGADDEQADDGAHRQPSEEHGITDIVATLFYQPEIITSYFGDGSAFGVSMQYRKAEADYGTAGSVRNAADFLNERFIVISGDVLTDFDLSKAIAYHEKKKAKATLVLTHSKNPLQFGVVITNNDGKITRFLEKPSWGEVFSDTINTGIYIIEPDVLQLVPYQQDYDFSKNLFPLLLEKDAGLFGYISDGYWRDVGNLNEYQEAHLDALDAQVHIHLEGAKKGNVTSVRIHTTDAHRENPREPS